MTKDIVIVPSSWRPEFLYLTLEALAQCPEVSNKEIWIVEDHKPTDDAFPETMQETVWVIEFWQKVFGKRLIPKIRPVNTFLGNSYNVLSAYNAAYNTDCKYVYLIEDDIIVAKDFFKWHEAIQWMVAQEELDWLCSIAGASDSVPPTSDIAYFLSDQYRSLGVCWPRKNLVTVIEHNGPLYYSTEQGMVDYLFNMFPNTKYKFNEMIEQDGLICRIMERDNKLACWSVKNLAFHIGLWGYHRSIGQKEMIDAGFNTNNSIQDRIEILRRLLKDEEWINRVASFQTDIQLPQ